jgi:hypothetical protein
VGKRPPHKQAAEVRLTIDDVQAAIRPGRRVSLAGSTIFGPTSKLALLHREQSSRRRRRFQARGQFEARVFSLAEAVNTQRIIAKRFS